MDPIRFEGWRGSNGFELLDHGPVRRLMLDASADQLRKSADDIIDVGTEPEVVLCMTRTKKSFP